MIYKMVLSKDEKVTFADVRATSYVEAVRKVTARLPDVYVACMNGGSWSERER